MKPIPFGKYTLVERISHGGMAEVFRATTQGEAGFQRVVAIKVLLPQVATDQDFVTMLIDEAKIAGQLSHDNIAQIFDLGEIDGRYFIVQEFVQGRDLRSILRLLADGSRRFSVAQACHLILKICEGLDYAHHKRDADGRPLLLVHRDISPQNILISDQGDVKLIDFGIVKAEGRSTKTLAGLVKGKFAYMSPEQIRGLPVDRRSDVFACGIILHELLTNRPLFRRKSEFETLTLARNAVAAAPSEQNGEVAPELDAIVLRALSRHVEDRYQTALELRDALWSFAHEHDQLCSRSDLGSWLRSLEDGVASTAPAADALPAADAADADEEELTHDSGDDDEPTDDTSDGDGDGATVVDPFARFNAAGDDDDVTDDDAAWAADALRSAIAAGDAPAKSPFEDPTPVFDARALRAHISRSRRGEMDGEAIDPEAETRLGADPRDDEPTHDRDPLGRPRPAPVPRRERETRAERPSRLRSPGDSEPPPAPRPRPASIPQRAPRPPVATRAPPPSSPPPAAPRPSAPPTRPPPQPVAALPSLPAPFPSPPAPSSARPHGYDAAASSARPHSHAPAAFAATASLPAMNRAIARGMLPPPSRPDLAPAYVQPYGAPAPQATPPPPSARPSASPSTSFDSYWLGFALLLLVIAAAASLTLALIES